MFTKPVARTEYDKIEPFSTKDGSIIRELMHPDIHGNFNQSLAEATVQVGGITLLHKHIKSAEIYHITSGHGLMFLGGSNGFEVMAGDTVSIPAGMPHKIQNVGDTPLKILCCSSPAYSNEDTELL